MNSERAQREESGGPPIHAARTDSGERDVPRKTRRGYAIDIFKGWCKSCGICAAFCPRECIQLDEEGAPFVEDSSCCTGCGWCEVHCPDFAISVRARKASSRQHDEE